MPAYPAKAELTAESGSTTITFMFNPSELSFSRTMQINSCSGARTDDGTPKVSFGYFNPYSLSISNILFDTYETGKDVMSEYISTLQDALEFKSASERRPPIYLFAWGDREYLRCFVQSLSYKLTLFLPDGTPVRAVVDLSLQQIDEWDPPPSTSNSNPSPAERSASSR